MIRIISVMLSVLILGACAAPPVPQAQAQPAACKVSLDADRHNAESAGYTFSKRAMRPEELQKTIELYNATPGDKLVPGEISEGYLAATSDSVVIVLIKDGCAVAHMEVGADALKQIFGLES